MAGGVNLYTYADLNPVSLIDPLGLLVLYGGVSGTVGAGGDTTYRNQANYYSGSVGGYAGHKDDGTSGMGWQASGNVGRIVGLTYGGGPFLGVNFGNVESFEGSGTGVTGIILGPFSAELTFDKNMDWSGFAFGFLHRGLGLGFFGAESNTVLLETDSSNPCESKGGK